MKQLAFSTIIFFVSILKISAQNFEFGKVLKSELEEKFHKIDTNAVAAILFKNGKTYFSYDSNSGFTANHTFEFRIKIYKQEGLSWANQKVLYYVGYDNLKDDSVRFSSAVTYNLEDGIIVKTKLNSEGDFKNKINKFWNEATIILPNVKVGSVIEYKYVLKSDNLVRLPDFDFQYDIPVNFFRYKTEIPEFFIYNSLLKGTAEIESSLELTDSDRSYAIGYKQINKVYSSQNIPALKKEKFVDNFDNYKGSILNELEKSRFPDWPVSDYASTWESVAKTVFKDKHFGKELSLKDYFSEDLKNLLQKTKNPVERLNVIFKFVQNSMNWNKKNGYYIDKGVEKAYQERTGNIAEINIILIAMLKNAGIKVSPVLVSTIENGIPVFPNRTVFNYVIGAAEINGQQFLLDATNKFTTPNILPLNLLNWKGRLIKENGDSEEIELIPLSLSEDEYILKGKIMPLAVKIEGTLIAKKTDYSAFNFREINAHKKEDVYIEELEDEIKNIQIKDYSIINRNEGFEKPVIENYNFILNNSFEVTGKNIFLNPLLFFTDTKNPFVQEERQMPIYFGYPHRYIYNISLELPNEYVIESIPKPIRIVSENRELSFTMNIVYEENKIKLKVIKEINKAIFAVDDYYILKDFFKLIIEKENVKIILKKL